MANGNNRPMITLVLGIVGIICCGLAAPVAWYMGKQELAAIAAGQAAREGEQLAKVGMILGIIGTVLLALTLIWIFFAGGMAFLGALSGAAGQ
jgi:hypothetical protein